ncbi:MAG: 50S ribosomal protein L22 [Desulfatiglans sp.]|jgi:large subunit ribosomal protein L22|nr:50S ribosomal protein L22 [Desulfatiglans sp.]
MESSAVARYIRISPRKVRLVIDQVRGKRVEDAVNMLKFAPQKGALFVLKLINSAVANAQQMSDVDVDKLYVKSIFADEGPMLKRIIPRASGRATRILKRTSHLTVVLNDK